MIIAQEDIYSDAALGIVTMTQMFLLMLYFHFTAAKEEQVEQNQLLRCNNFSSRW